MIGVRRNKIIPFEPEGNRFTMVDKLFRIGIMALDPCTQHLRFVPTPLATVEWFPVAPQIAAVCHDVLHVAGFVHTIFATAHTTMKLVKLGIVQVLTIFERIVFEVG